MLKKNEVTLVWITSLGGLLEFYDFIIYALMAGYLSEQFFPGHDTNSSLLATFATFSVGYFSRPLGGLLFGHLGDRYGRKRTFAATVLIMAISTALIGCLPTYHQIGIWAPILITLLRLIQGFSIGGEIPGAITYLSESTSKHQGLVISLLFTALVNGFVLGSVVHSSLIEWLGADAMAEWGWRLPFWFGGVLGLFSYLVRKHFHESPLFAELNRNKQRQQIPLIVLLQAYKRAVFIGILLIVPVAVSMSLLFLFTQSYLTRLLSYAPEQVSNAGSIGIIISTLLFILVGWLADKHKSQKYKLSLMVSGSLTVSCLAFPIFSAFADFHFSVYGVMLLSSLPLGMTTGIAPLLLSTVFPTSIRYSGIAFSYNVSFAIFGGLTPVIAMTLINTTESLISPSYYLAASGLCGLLACYLLQRSVSS